MSQSETKIARWLISWNDDGDCVGMHPIREDVDLDRYRDAEGDLDGYTLVQRIGDPSRLVTNPITDWESKFRDAVVLLKDRDEEVKRLKDELKICEKWMDSGDEIRRDTVLKLESENKRLRDLIDLVDDEAQCGCSIAERNSGHLVGCWRPDFNERLRSLKECQPVHAKTTEGGE